MFEAIKTFFETENLAEAGMFPMNLSGIGLITIGTLLAIAIFGEIIHQIRTGESWLF